MSPAWNRNELRSLLGDIEDAKLTAILALSPTMEDIEVASARFAGAEDKMPDGGWPLQGKAAQIFDILITEFEDDSEPN
jgi:hypothetical protein